MNTSFNAKGQWLTDKVVIENLSILRSRSPLSLFLALADSRPWGLETPGPRGLSKGFRVVPPTSSLSNRQRRNGLKILEKLGIAIIRPLAGAGLQARLQVLFEETPPAGTQGTNAFLEALGPQLAARLDPAELAARLSFWGRQGVLDQAIAVARQASRSDKNNSILRPLSWIDKTLEQGRGQAALVQEQGRAAEARRAKAAAAAVAAQEAQAARRANLHIKKIADVPKINNDFMVLREKRRADRAALTEELAKAAAGGAQ